MKKIIVMFLCIMMALSIAACNRQESSTSTTDNNSQAVTDKSNNNGNDGKRTILKIGIDSTLDTLDPWGTPKPSHYFICGTLYQPLGFAKTPNSQEIEGILMKEWEQTGDYTYDVTLYDNIRDNAGNSFTADDAIFSFEQYKSKNTCNIKELKKKDSLTFTMILDTAAPGTFQTLCQEVLMCTKAAFDASGDEFAATACGTAPYKLQKFESGSKVILEIVDDYWQTDDSLNNESYAANADVIEFDILTELTQLSGAIEQGSVQMICWADNSQLDELEEYENLEILAVPDTESRGIMLNMTENSPFYDNPDLRKAVLYAIDKELMIENITYGAGVVSPSILYSEEVTVGFNPEWSRSNPYSYDPEKAKEYLEKAGYKEGELTLRLLANNNKVVKTVMETIQGNLMAIGIDASVDIYDGSTYGGYRDGTSGMYEIAYCGAQQGGSAIKILDTVFNGNNRDSGGTWFGLVDPELQGMYDDLTRPGGFTEENIDRIYNYIQDGAYYYQMFMKPTYCVYNKDLIAGVHNDARNFMAFGATELAEGYDVFAD